MSEARSGPQRRRLKLRHRASTTQDVPEQRRLEALLRQNFGAFAERCFNELSSSQEYLHNWHLDVLAYHLGEVMTGRCKRLLITMPPRSPKSLFASVALPAFMLGHDPTRRIICVSYASDLAVTHANSFRAIVSSAWYRTIFRDMRVDPRKDTETEVRTTRGGYRLTTTIGGSLTGRGGSVIIIDDPMTSQHLVRVPRKAKAGASPP